jgi:4-amino-4-deoxy-L-arabinose transferase-like glycosyltransferase
MSRQERLALATLAFFAFVNALLWSLTLAPGRSPDEMSHLGVVLFEAEHGRIPELGVDDAAATYARAPDGQFYPYYPYSAQPGLAYLIDAAAVRLSGARGEAAVHAARLPGVCYAALLPLAVFWGALRMTRRRDAAWLAAALSAIWPQVTFLFSYVNNDGLTVLLSALAIGSWYAGLESEWRLRDVLRTAALAGLLLANKPNGFLVAAGSIAALGTMRPPRVLQRAIAALLALLVSGGWWYLIAWQRYGSDLFGYRRSAEALQRLHGVWPSARHDGIGFVQLLAGTTPRFPESWFLVTARSSFGVFGRMSLFLSPAEYAVVLLFVIAGAAGLLRAFGSRPAAVDRRRMYLHGVTALVSAALVFAAAYRSWAVDYQAQGRHLFPALLPFFALLALGLCSLPPPLGRSLPRVAIVTILAINILALLVTLVTAYAGSATAWASAHPVAVVVWVVGVGMMLGVSVAKSRMS